MMSLREIGVCFEIEDLVSNRFGELTDLLPRPSCNVGIRWHWSTGLLRSLSLGGQKTWANFTQALVNKPFYSCINRQPSYSQSLNSPPVQDVGIRAPSLATSVPVVVGPLQLP